MSAPLWGKASVLLFPEYTAFNLSGMQIYIGISPILGRKSWKIVRRHQECQSRWIQRREERRWPCLQSIVTGCLHFSLKCQAHISHHRVFLWASPWSCLLPPRCIIKLNATSLQFCARTSTATVNKTHSWKGTRLQDKKGYLHNLHNYLWYFPAGSLSSQPPNHSCSSKQALDSMCYRERLCLSTPNTTLAPYNTATWRP